MAAPQCTPDPSAKNKEKARSARCPKAVAGVSINHRHRRLSKYKVIQCIKNTAHWSKNSAVWLKYSARKSSTKFSCLMAWRAVTQATAADARCHKNRWPKTKPFRNINGNLEEMNMITIILQWQSKSHWELNDCMPLSNIQSTNTKPPPRPPPPSQI